MAKTYSSAGLDRRKFLAAAAVTGAASTVRPAEATAPAQVEQHLPSALPPNAHVAAAETGTPQMPARDNGTPGSDFMVDVIKTLDIKYLPANPASSFRGIHESLINYGKNTMPEFLTCMHEESAVGMCHGYFKATGKPLMTLCHGVVGLQHAAMAIYNAWCDRVPMLIVGGNDLDAARRALPACRLFIRSRTSTRLYATSPNGTTRQSRCSISHRVSCECIKSRRRRPMGR
jgi:acetolactate synthase-1/2/3 large subunit